jgi:hypothetical protein
MSRTDYTVPPEGAPQFDLIEAATGATLHWAERKGHSLEHIYPVVPSVDTDFSLDAWLFLDTEERIRECSQNGIADVLVSVSSYATPGNSLERTRDG